MRLSRRLKEVSFLSSEGGRVEGGVSIDTKALALVDEGFLSFDAPPRHGDGAGDGLGGSTSGEGVGHLYAADPLSHFIRPWIERADKPSKW